MPCTGPRIAVRRSASKLASSPRFVVDLSLFQDPVEFPRARVCLDLCIPGRPVTLKEPIAEFSEFLSGKLADLALDVFNLAHMYIIPLEPRRTESRRLTSELSGGAEGPCGAPLAHAEPATPMRTPVLCTTPIADRSNEC